ncbi:MULTISPECIES: AMP-binding protein [Flavobacteriaceae]|uniref:AMP-binding protein n=1 Tax=Flavobacteriaceae TaxID=49546 RepID=UPI001490CEE7|nr:MULTISPECIES: AMP-binding protein [Allomuricauda]MDC6364496.1 AMP-binding protein [Muricauda sp. AC10]
MANQTWHSIHPNFKLNGVHYSLEDILEVGYSLIKEGEFFEAHIGNFLLDWATPKPTLEVFTSGSTGKPKKIELKKEHMVNSALATGTYFNLKPSSSTLLCLPCTGIAGKMMLVRAMVLGLDLDYIAPSSTPLQENDRDYDFVAMVPLQAQNSITYLNRVKTLIVGGAPVDTSLRIKLAGLSTAVYETYGMTETITHIAVKRITKTEKEMIEAGFELLPNVSVARDDRDCLVIDAPMVTENSVVTNDIVALIDTTHFKWLGRYDSIINSGGIKLIPEQIEEKLSKLIRSRFFVAGLPDTSLGQKLILLVEDKDANTEELLQSIKSLSGITKYEIPKEIFLVDSFVETASGKIQRGKTLEQIL